MLSDYLTFWYRHNNLPIVERIGGEPNFYSKRKRRWGSHYRFARYAKRYFVSIETAREWFS
jgi:hypothetical protein